MTDLFGRQSVPVDSKYSMRVVLFCYASVFMIHWGYVQHRHYSYVITLEILSIMFCAKVVSGVSR